MHAQCYPEPGCAINAAEDAPQPIVDLAHYLHDYDRYNLAIGLTQNIDKFVLMQSVNAIGTRYDVARYLHLFPKDSTGRGPRIERHQIDVNGVSVGPEHVVVACYHGKGWLLAAYLMLGCFERVIRLGSDNSFGGISEGKS